MYRHSKTGTIWMLNGKSDGDDEDIDEDDINDDELTESYYRQTKLQNSCLTLSPEVNGADFRFRFHEDRLINDAHVYDTKFSGFVRRLDLDIQKYFGKQEQKDWCDIFENKWNNAGIISEQLLYRDILKGTNRRFLDDSGIHKTKIVDKESTSYATNIDIPDIVNTNLWCKCSKCKEHREQTISYEGNLQACYKYTRTSDLGPLEELFGKTPNSKHQNTNGEKFTLSTDTKLVVAKQNTNGGIPDSDQNNIIMNKLYPVKETYIKGTALIKMLPMNKRKLPASFWKEPGNEHPVKRNTIGKQSLPMCLEKEKGKADQLTSPDFADLLESWTPDG